MKQFVQDVLVLLAVALMFLFVKEAMSRTPEERRATRRATEVMYEACVNTCSTQCAKPPR